MEALELREARLRFETTPAALSFDAHWLTDFTAAEAGPRSLFKIAKSRWRSRTRASTTARTAMAWSTSPITTKTAC
jgi:hypothetical protein